MRVLRIALVVLVAAPFTAYAAQATATARQGRCATPQTLAAPTLPAAIRISTSCGSFVLARDGRLVRVSSDPPPAPWLATNGVWSRSDHGRLVVGRGDRMFWRSPGRFPNARTVDDVVLGRDELAFSTLRRTSELYVAPLAGHEHLVAAGEFPLGLAPDGFYAWRLRGAELVLRSSTGRLRGTIARFVGTHAFVPDSRSLLFVEHGRLLRAHGTDVETIVDLSRLGPPTPHLQILPLGRLIGLEGERRLVVLRPDGSIFASTPLPFASDRVEFVSGSPVASPGGTAVAFAAIRGDSLGQYQVMERGVETIYVLRPGAHTAAAVVKQRTWFDVCGHSADLVWHGNWLLYAADGGGAAAVEVDSGRVTGLSSIVRRVPGFPRPDPAGSFAIGWS